MVRQAEIYGEVKQGSGGAETKREKEAEGGGGEGGGDGLEEHTDAQTLLISMLASQERTADLLWLR